MTRFCVAIVLACFAVCEISAQTPIPVGARVGESPSGYDAGGRRDPFVSLVTPKPTTPAQVAKAPGGLPSAGLGGVSVNDVSVKGIMRSGATLIALLQGPDGRTFIARRQDKLQDGVVTRIELDAVTFNTRSVDAVGASRARDVRKTLHPISGGRP
jgi:Tfp pilus assembly protein PilP